MTTKPQTLSSRSSPGPSIGLALGGGGARGISHIVVLEALDELGVKPDVIAGTSIGALLGAGYAAGLTGKEIREHTIGVFSNLSSLIARLWTARPRGSFGRRTLFPQFDPEDILEMVVPDHVRGEIEGQRIPLTLITTDYFGWREKALRDGPLRKGVAASMALPMLFSPVKYEDYLLIDGGASNPLPFDHVSQADIVVAVDVMGGPEPHETRDVPRPTAVMFGAMQILTQAVITEKLANHAPDILVRPDINQFKILDFLKSKAILEAAEPLKDGFKRQLEAAIEMAEEKAR